MNFKACLITVALVEDDHVITSCFHMYPSSTNLNKIINIFGKSISKYTIQTVLHHGSVKNR